MKLQNKNTGEIITSRELLTDEFLIDLFSKDFNYFNSKINKILKEWEVFKEDRIYWFIDVDGEIKSKELGWFNQAQGNIGNRFETKEEAEKAVEKLKAWKRLKDKGFVFKGISEDDDTIKTGLSKSVSLNDCEEFYVDMKLLFGGEE